ncbi:hypothetical protein OAT84_04120, partial [Gammaproteobacteria bacterium]|nr:hypothetical protein [Gammaproteobacteria bacterium]
MPIFLVALLCLTPFLAQASTAELEVLKEISDFLKAGSEPSDTELDTIMDKSWGSANLLQAVNPFDFGTTNPIKNILESKLNEDTSDLATIQSILDVITYDVRKPRTNPTIGSGVSHSIPKKHTTKAESILQDADTKAYRTVLQASDRVKSCIAYWHIADPDSNKLTNPLQGKPINAWASSDALTSPLPQSETEAAKKDSTKNALKIDCRYMAKDSKAQRAFNGYTTIGSITIPKIKKTSINANIDKVNATFGETITSQEAAKAWLEKLDNHLDELAADLQTHLALKIVQTLKLESSSLSALLVDSP